MGGLSTQYITGIRSGARQVTVFGNELREVSIAGHIGSACRWIITHDKLADFKGERHDTY